MAPEIARQRLQLARVRGDLHYQGPRDYDYSLDSSHVLANCTDFLSEKGALEHLLNSRGHLCKASPKCHPELAGNGVEYAWGIIKRRLRRANIDQNNRQLRENIEKQLDFDLAISWRFQRKARTYRRVYNSLPPSEAGCTYDSKSSSTWTPA